MRSPPFLLKTLVHLMVVAGAFCAGTIWQGRSDRALIRESDWRARELAEVLANTSFIIPEARAGQQFVPLSELVVAGQGAAD